MTPLPKTFAIYYATTLYAFNNKATRSYQKHETLH